MRPIKSRLGFVSRLAAIVLVSCQAGPAMAGVKVPGGGSADAAQAENLAAVARYYDAVEALDFEAFMGTWAENGRLEIPFMAVLNRNSKADIAAGFKPRFEAIETVTVEFEAVPIEGGEQVFARADFDFVFKNGVRYQNAGVALFTFEEPGKISRMEEWVNPERYRAAFGDPPAPSGSQD